MAFWLDERTVGPVSTFVLDAALAEGILRKHGRCPAWPSGFGQLERRCQRHLHRGQLRSSPYAVHGLPTRSGRMPCESVDGSEDVPKEPARQVALGQLKYLLKIDRLCFDGQPDQTVQTKGGQ